MTRHPEGRVLKQNDIFHHDAALRIEKMAEACFDRLRGRLSGMDVVAMVKTPKKVISFSCESNADQLIAGKSKDKALRIDIKQERERQYQDDSSLRLMEETVGRDLYCLARREARANSEDPLRDRLINRGLGLVFAEEVFRLTPSCVQAMDRSDMNRAVKNLIGPSKMDMPHMTSIQEDCLGYHMAKAYLSQEGRTAFLSVTVPVDEVIARVEQNNPFDLTSAWKPKGRSGQRQNKADLALKNG